MNDYSDLIKRLKNKREYYGDNDCNEAAIAILHLLSEIDVLDDAWKRDKDRIAELEAALKPFADIETLFCDSDEMEFKLWTFVRADLTVDKPMIKVGDLRNARKALEKGDE